MKSENHAMIQVCMIKKFKIFYIFMMLVLVCDISLTVMLFGKNNKNPLTSKAETASMATPLAHIDVTSVLILQAKNRLAALQKEEQVVLQQLQILRSENRVHRDEE